MVSKSRDIGGIPGWLILMGLLTMTVPLGIDVYLPAFPDIAQQYQVPISAVEQTMPVFLVGLALGQLFYGPISDRYGRRMPLFVGLGLFTLGAFLCAFAPALEWLVAGRVVQALGCAGCMVIPRAVIRDHYEPQAAARAMSMLLLISSAAPLLAPSLGGQILRFFAWPAVFQFQGLFGLALLGLMSRQLQESLPVEGRQPAGVWRSLKVYGLLLRDSQFITMSLCGGLAMSGLFAYLTGSPRVFIEVFGLSPQWYGPIFGLNAVIMVIASQTNSRLLRRRTPSFLLQRALWVWVVLAVGVLVLAAMGQLGFPVVLSTVFMLMAGLGFISPNGTALALAFQGQRLGSASALMGALQFIGGTLGGLAVSLWATETALNLVVIMGVCMLLSCAVGHWGLHATRRVAAERGESGRL